MIENCLSMKKIVPLHPQNLKMEKARSKFVDILMKVVKFILFFGVGILCIYLCIKGMTAEQMREVKESAFTALRGHGWIFIALAFLAGVLSDYIRALRNRQLLQPLGYNVRRSSAFFSVMVCYITNLALPRVGEVLRCTFLHQYERVPFQKTLGTVVTERAVDMVCLLVVLITAILANTGILSRMVVDDVGTTLGEKLNSSFIGMLHNYKFFIVLAICVVGFVIAYRTREKWGKVGFFAKIRNFFAGMWQGLISIKDLENPWLFLAYSLAIWLLYFAEALFCCNAFPFLTGLDILAVYTVFAMGNIGFLVAPGGIGSYPLIVAYALLLYNVPLTQGFAVGWVAWGVQTVMVLSVGTIALVAASVMKKQVAPEMNNQEITKSK